MLHTIRAFRRKTLRAFATKIGPARLRRRLPGPRKIVIGSAGKHGPGWLPTERGYLNLLNPEDWAEFFVPESLDALLAEHVWEHLTYEEGRRAAGTCYTFLRPGGYLRIAVPDGLHPSPTYQSWVRPHGTTPWNGHKVLYTYGSLSQIFVDAGFQVRLYEYFDETGRFYHHPWSIEDGLITRSKQHDRRNRNGELVFTSIILDAVKPSQYLAMQQPLRVSA